MDFERIFLILAVALLAVLIVQPVASADTMADILSSPNVANVTSANVEKDVATSFYNQAEQLLVKGDFENAIKLYDRALAENTSVMKKTDALLYLYRDKAYALIQLGKDADAIATLDEGLALYPKDAMLWNNKGFALSNLGKQQDALKAYDSAVSFDKNYTTAYINQGELLTRMGRYSDAVAAYTKANETDPFNIAASDGLQLAKKGESQSNLTTTIVVAVVLIAAIGIIVWYVRFRKPAEPAPEGKKSRSKKKE